MMFQIKKQSITQTVLFIFLGIGCLQAQQRFVANTGTDVANDCLLPGNPCASIGYAIDQANEGDIIQVAAGTYNENLVIDKQVSLRGAKLSVDGNDPSRNTNETIILPASSATALIQINAGDVEIDGFTIDGNQNVGQGISIINQRNATISNNIIRRCRSTSTNTADPPPTGIFASGNSSRNLFQRNKIELIFESSITINSLTPPSVDDFVLGRGITLRDNFYVDIINNTFENLSVGIIAEDFNAIERDIIWSNNLIDPRLIGIGMRRVNNGSAIGIDDNTILGDAAQQGLDITVNAFGETGTLRVPNAGISFSEVSSPISLSDNTIQGTYYGYFILDVAPASNLIISGGTVSQAAIGIAAVNDDLAGTTGSSTFRIDGVNLDNFFGEPFTTLPESAFFGLIPIREPTIRGFNFHAGIYLFAADNGQTINATIQDCTIDGTERNDVSNSAGIYATASGANLINISALNCTVQNNQNRGIFLNDVQGAVFQQSSILNNGFDGFNADGIAINLEGNALATFSNCIMNTPASAGLNAQLRDAASIVMTQCSITSATIPVGFFDPFTTGTANVSACWWGSANEPVGFGLSNANNLDYTPWLGIGTDTDLITPGFQPTFSDVNVTRKLGQFGTLERIEEALALVSEGGTLRAYPKNGLDFTYDESVVIDKNLFWETNGNVEVRDLEMNGTGKTFTLNNNFILTDAGILTLRDGIIATQANVLYVKNPDVNAVVNPSTGSWIHGTLRRVLNSNDFYSFPVGDDDSQEVALVRRNDALTPTLDLSAEFIPNDPFNDPAVSSLVAFNENGTDFNALLTNGYWNIEPNNATNSNDFDVRLFPTFLGGLEGAIVKRENASTVWNRQGSPEVIAGGVGRLDFTGFSDFAIAVPDGALPLDLLSFEALREEELIILRWLTVREENVSHFELERSQDGFSFEQIARLEARGQNGLETEYSYVDSQAPLLIAPILYYRLKLVDLDDTFRYSPPIFVDRSERINLSLKLFPNPAPRELFIEMNQPNIQRLIIQDPQGQVKEIKEISSTFVTFDISDWTTGLYIFKFIGNEKIFVKKMLIAR